MYYTIIINETVYFPQTIEYLHVDHILSTYYIRVKEGNLIYSMVKCPTLP